jgi:hypothetical protein
MAMKPNYGQQRAERNRAKQAKAEQKKREKAEQVEQRRSAVQAPTAEPGGSPGDSKDT